MSLNHHIPKAKIAALIYFSIFQMVFCNVLFAQDVQPKPKPKQQGLLWEITGNNLKKPSYLYGTMHVSKKLAFHLSDTFFVALKSCDMVALEINPETFMEEVLASRMVSMSMNLSYYSYGDFFDKAFAMSTPDNKTFAYTLSKDNDFANYLLYRSQYRENFEESTYLDLFIFQAGKKLNKKVFGLEIFDQTTELSIKANMEEEGDEEDKYEGEESSYSDRMGRHDKLEDAYRKGDLDALDSLSKLNMTKKYLKYMINYRNELMANRMDSLMQHLSLFTGIGAAHLPGEEGVINMLRRKGYTVRAVTRDILQTDAKAKDKIEKTIYKLNYTTQYSGDSIIRVNLPGKMVDGASISTSRSRSSSSVKEYFFAEMVNGAYYRISRINTYSPVEEVNEAYILKRIDSLLYENIPGKILKKKSITQNGFPGYDITNKTKKGDVQRFRVVVTPIEVIVFQLAGIGEFVTVEGEKFFGSIVVKNKANSEWNTYKQESKIFAVSMPGQMTIEDNTLYKAGSRRDYHIQSIDDANKNYYFFTKASYHDFSYIEEDTFELNYLAKSFYKEFKYKPSSQKFITVGGFPAIDLHLKKENKDDIFLRIVIAGTDYYCLGLKGKGSLAEAAQKYFNTLSIGTPVYTKEFKEYYDSTLYFKVKSPVNPYGDSKLAVRLISLYKKRKTKHETFKSQRRELKFNSPATSEVISVEYQKFNDYKSFESPDKFWETRLKYITDDSSMVINKKSTNKDGMDFILTDTNSTRAIKVKLILRGGVLYSVFANIDTLRKESLFVKTFFETFQPGDTVIGVPLFSNKADRFFEKVAKGDSAVVTHALMSVNTVKFEDKHAPQLINVFETCKFSKYSKEVASVKQDFISAIGSLHHKSVIPFLEKQYKGAGDTVSVQVTVLTALGHNKRLEANLSILRLLKTEVPLAEEDEIRSVFYGFRDSLKIASNLFPELLQYTRYPEYKDNIYQLLATLKDSGFVKPEVYVASKSDILREANEELKRKISSEEEKDDRNSYSSYEDDYEDDVYDGPSFGYFNRSYSRYSRRSGGGRSKLEYYSTLLMPSYQEASVKSYFTKLCKIKDKNLLLSSYILLLKNNKEVNDTVWTHFASNDTYRIKLYKKLKEIKRLEKMDEKFMTQELMYRGILYAGKKIDKDSVVLMERRKTTIKGKDVYVYFYKRKAEKAKSWKIDYVGMELKDTTKFEISYFSTQKDKIYKKNELTKFMDDTMEDYSLQGRKRVSRSYMYRRGNYDSIDSYYED